VGDVEGAGVVFYGVNGLLLLDRFFVLFWLFVCLDVIFWYRCLDLVLNGLFFLLIDLLLRDLLRARCL
jgi:hypothetical protein